MRCVVIIWAHVVYIKNIYINHQYLSQTISNPTDMMFHALKWHNNPMAYDQATVHFATILITSILKEENTLIYIKAGNS